MHPRINPRAGAGLSLAVAGALTLLTACGSSHPAAGAADTSLSPGAGQSLAGVPGDAGTGSPATTAMPGMTMTAPATGAPSAPVAGDTVAIKNFAFAPGKLVVKVGTTVTWTNQDTDAHTVTSTGSGGPLKSAALGTGGTFSYTFTKPGTYDYLCTIHPFMTATVTVTA